ncbi:hypothetical protein HER32_00550 [Hymenobacter sp. BT18]|uniref:hypothetical protein n=1 Tax=Hymenobacter sp. BT18 TaxID=2835648 RepID=UPI00143E360C|nr:hypothetical protein [Hymenobacter sp. BT18]QIX59759.1 hypothetical protein HER32_00550 [Hymenobacter sp. BT18]
MRVLDIIQISPQEVFIVGYPDGPVVPGPWELRLNGETVAVLEATGEAQLEAQAKGKLALPRAVVCRGQVERKRFDFTRDEVTLERAS